MVLASSLSSWMMSRVHSDVKLLADKIMSRYDDSRGQPLWRPPVLAIHIRHGDKAREDPYYRSRGEYLPLTNFAEKVSAMEQQHGLKWQSILILSDSGTAREALMNLLLDRDDENNVNASSALSSCGPANGHPEKRCLMYDWTTDDHLLEHYKEHAVVPPELKRDIQLHFLASLYIVQKIADHAVVTYSSNVGRFMSELITARFRMAYPGPDGPLATSLDYGWFWK